MGLPGLTLSVRAHPRAARERVEWRGDVLHVWVHAAPAGGEANRAVLDAVARSLGVPASSVRLLSGARGRDKRFAVDRP